jgi:putative transposase
MYNIITFSATNLFPLMPAAYSIDLRRRVRDAYLNKEGSQRQIARRFNVSLTFVINLLKHERITGTITPKQYTRGRSPKITCESENLILSKVEKEPDILLKELCDYVEEETGILVSQSTMYRFLIKKRLTRKKKVFMPQSKKEKIFSKNVMNIGNG